MPARKPPQPNPLETDEHRTKVAGTGPPPAKIAGLGNIDGDGSRTVTIRSTPPGDAREFTLRPKMPGMLLMRLTKKRMELARPGALQDEAKLSGALVATGDALAMLVVEDERDDFIDHLIEVEPAIDVAELMTIMETMIATVTNRPTKSA